MSETTATAKIRPYGTVVKVVSRRGKEIPFEVVPARPMTEVLVKAAVSADPDARPMTQEELRKARRVPTVKTLRRALVFTRGKNSRFATKSRSGPCVIGSRAERSRIGQLAHTGT